MAGIEDVLDLTEAAEIAGVTPARLRQLIEAGQLRAKKVGNSWAVHTHDLNALLGRENRTAGRPDKRKALESRLRIELRPMSPIEINLQPYNPEMRLWFRVDNLSDLEVDLDRLLVEVWYPQPVAEGAILDRYTIAPNESISTPMFHAWLPPDKIKSMVNAATNPNQYAELQIYVRAYFDTPIGWASVQTRITRARGEFPITLPRSAPS
jgi:hypothetical protein